MTQIEFFNRTGVEVSPKEFQSIHEVYCDSDLDKDSFCKMWVKMNASRVAKAKADAKAKAQELAQHDFIWDLIMQYGSISTCSDEMHKTLAVNVLNEKQIQTLEKMGIDMREPDYGYGVRFFKRMSTVLYEIDKILQAA